MSATSCRRLRSALVIGIVPSETPAVLMEEFSGIQRYLERELNREIHVYIPDDYRRLIDAMEQGNVDIGLFGPFSYIVADRRMDLVPLLVRKKLRSGVTYKSLIITMHGSDHRSLADLQNTRFAFVNPASTSGFIIPQSLFVSRNINIETWFEEYHFTGSHDLVYDEVISGKVDAGAISNTILDRLIEKEVANPSDFRILWSSEDIPGSPYVARDGVRRSIINQFNRAMIDLHINDPEALEQFDSSIEFYVPTTEDQYDSIRNITNLLGWDFVEKHFL